jgi:pyridoxine 5'-phosphate synthase PdxJ
MADTFRVLLLTYGKPVGFSCHVGWRSRMIRPGHIELFPADRRRVTGGRGWLLVMDATTAGEAVQRLHAWRRAVEELAAAADRAALDADLASHEIALLHVLSHRAAEAFADYEAVVLTH